MSSLSLNNKLINSVSKLIIYENNVKVIENNLIDFRWKIYGSIIDEILLLFKIHPKCIKTIKKLFFNKNF